jgi:hypothetical protein
VRNSNNCENAADLTVHKAVGKPSQEVTSRPVEVGRPTVWRLGDEIYCMIDLGHECIRSVFATLSVPFTRRRGFGYRIRVKLNPLGSHPLTPVSGA